MNSQIFPFSIFEEIVETYDGTLYYYQGDGSGMNQNQGAPLLYMLENLIKVEPVNNGCSRVNFAFFLGRQSTLDDQSNPQSTLQTSQEQMTVYVGQMYQLAYELEFILKNKVDSIQSGGFSWTVSPNKLPASTALVGVVVTGSFVCLTQSCESDFHYPATIWQIQANGQSPTVIPDGVVNGDIIEFINTTPDVVTSFTGFPNWTSLTFRSAENTNVTICNNWLNSGIYLDEGFNVVLAESASIVLKKERTSIRQVSGQGITYPTGIYITGVNGSHEATVLATYLAQYPEAEDRIVQGYLPYPDSGLPSASIFFAQIMQAGGYRCEQLTISYTSAISNVALRDYISEQIPSVVLPIGGNSNIEIMSPTSMLDNSFVFVSGGNETQRTLSYGNALELWDSNLDNSYVVPLIAAKLMQIADGREDGDNLFERHVGARWSARATAIKSGTTHPNGQIWNKENGYGRPSVSGAIAYTGQVPTEIYVAIQDFTFSLIFN